jgi:hypothetical protein
MAVHICLSANKLNFSVCVVIEQFYFLLKLICMHLFGMSYVYSCIKIIIYCV